VFLRKELSASDGFADTSDSHRSLMRSIHSSGTDVRKEQLTLPARTVMPLNDTVVFTCPEEIVQKDV
jgi:hypothetical protein